MMRYSYNEGFNLKKTIAIIAVVILVVYGIYNARKLIEGPYVEVFEPANGVEIRENSITIKGFTKNITYLSLNDRPIAIDTSGFFEEKLLLSPGYNTIYIFANDRFKQDTLKELKIYYNDQTSTSTEASTISKNS